MDIFGEVQWSLEVKVSGFKGDVFGTLALEDTVDCDFEKINRCSFCSHVAWAFNAVTTNCDASSIGVLFFGAERAHKFRVCHLFLEVVGDVVTVYDV